MSGDLTGRSIASYRVTAKLGEGGMGEVYRATDTKLEREVALKVLPAAFTEDPERLARFEREAKLLAQLQHPNIASIYGLEESDGVRALVMELVEGPTLAERLEAGPLSLNECLTVSVQIAQALEEAHEKGIVHRDLKPQNIKASIDGKVKVLDFGLAKAMDPTAGAATSASHLAKSPTLTFGATVQGMILGTAAYMAPEQAAGGVADRRADVWSFGVVLYEMLSGRRLFDGETVSHVLAGVLKEEPDFSLLPPDTPPRIQRLVRRCLRKKPRERLQAIGDARVELEEVLAGAEDGPSPAALAAPAMPQRSTRPAWQIALAFAAAIALGALVATVITGRRLSKPAAPRTIAELSLPPGTLLPRGGTDPALSPDGTRLAFSLADEETQTRRLWIRTLATGDQRAVPGTESAQSPFWSPDGRSVGFVDFPSRQLERVDLDGGRPVPLARFDSSCGATWGRDAILFCVSPTAGLSRVSPSGGAVEPVIRPGKGERHYAPGFLPGGRKFTFLSIPTTGEDRLMVGSLDGGEARPLVATESKALVSDGRLYFLRGETLLSSAFDAAAGELAAGEPEFVAEGVDGQRGGQFTVAADLLVYAPRTEEAGSRIAIYARDGQRVDQIDSAQALDDFVLSADGRQAAVMKVGVGQDGTGRDVDVWTLDLARKVFRRATQGESDDDPVFSPDGRSIAYAHQGDLYRRQANGAGEPQLLVESEGDAVSLDWTHDGWIVFSGYSAEAEDLYAVRADGGEPRQLTATPFRERLAQVSPDGRWLAYASDEGGDPQVYLTTWPDAKGTWRVSTASAAMPRWGRGGSELYFLGQDNRLMRASIGAAGGEPEIGLAELLFPVQHEGNYFTRTARWDASADGERFYLLEAIPGTSQKIPVLVLVNHPLSGAGRER